MEAHHAEPDRALAHRRVARPLHPVRRAVDEVLQHVVEEAHHVGDEALVVLPLEPAFQVQAGQAAHRRPLHAVLVEAGRQRDLAAQVGGLHLQPGQLLMLGQRAVHVVAEHQVRLAGLDPRRQDADPQGARRDAAHHGAVLRRGQRPGLVGLDRAHEGIGDQDAVMQVERLAVRIAAGRAADFDELLDLGMRDRQIDRGRAAPQRALRDRQRQAVHHADEGDDARGLAVLPDLLADRAQIAPVAADAAALGGEPDILVPQPDDAVEAVGGFVQEAGDRQAALGAAIGQHRGRRHEPQPGHVVVDALGVRRVVAVVAGDAGEQVLVTLARQQIAVVQRGAAEIRQQGIPGPVDPYLVATLQLHRIEHYGTPWESLTTTS